jgi:predicted MPP superfamily phosphohydrolase
MFYAPWEHGMSKITRRKFLGLSALAVPAALGATAGVVESTSLRVTELKLNAAGQCRFVHFSDFHHKGDVRYAAEVVRRINDLKPEFVCFTGDLVEEAHFATEALGFIRQIHAPVYGAPGNHDFLCGASFLEYEAAFAATGGAWLTDRARVIPEHDLELVGMGEQGFRAFQAPRASKRILLLHYPHIAHGMRDQHFDLILAGHSHGGQVRLPFLGALIVPKGVGPYDHGYYDSPGGPLYVNAGIGTYLIPVRVNCRPEITVITI